MSTIDNNMEVSLLLPLLFSYQSNTNKGIIDGSIWANSIIIN